MSLRVGVFHPGTQHSWQTALAFQEVGALAWYATSIYYKPDRWPYKIQRLLPHSVASKVAREFSRRHFPALEDSKIRTFPNLAWLEVGASRLGAHELASSLSRRGHVAFGQSVIKLIESEPIDVVWGCNNTAVQVLRWAKKKGIPCVLDQTTGHRVIQNQITSAEWNCHPDFFSGGFKPISNDVIDQQNEEMELADIVAVGSEFCAQTMIECGCPASKIRIVNYGYDEAIFPTERPKGRASTQGPIRFLFVGSINPMKGVAHLLKAFQSIPNDEASLTLVGHLRIPKSTFERYSNRVQHRYHVPRNEIVQSFLDADCLVFPSLFEGSALVLRECYGAGIGIIQSANSGDGAVSGKNGIVLDEITAEAVNDAVGSVIEEPRLLEEWKNASWELRQDRTWAVYRQNVRDLVARLS